MKRRALISVTDKTGIVDFAKGLVDLGFSVLSTGGTFKALKDGGVPAEEVSEYTGFAEMMDGRVKSLHPKIHGGLLARRDNDADQSAMRELSIDPIDVLAVNLYRFRKTLAKPGVERQEIVENIDIGGPAMLRSAAKNHASVAVVVDPSDYSRILTGFEKGKGKLSEALLRELAGKAYAHTAAYDVAIADWFESESQKGQDKPAYGERFAIAGVQRMDLRYGENPHQIAALYQEEESANPGLAQAEQLSGKELSYNNLMDLDAALELVREFDEPACAIIKHSNPCGTALASNLEGAFRAALAADPLSAYGGIVALNRPLDLATASAMVAEGTFVEAIVAASVEDAALAKIKEARWGNNVRILSLGGDLGESHPPVVKPVSGGFLLQSADNPQDEPKLDPVTSRAPSDEEQAALAFAWKVCKHVKSNAIVLARSKGEGVYATVGVGAGQMSRVDSVEISVKKAGDLAKGAVLASDAFFPFADGLLAAAQAGVTAAIQPGGSRRDEEVIAAANEHDLAMVFTGRRHFRH
ncbi:MAG: bifunctional phosphoribosylaminoimidazolecarboxamide formyltransferase/IMP cyclohydrolase [Planctomycetota bacterium]|jgi:phosphoribosylaminoimidazolecarboxamide formyltransferase/IMP cyclohydrolase